jgi:hypothetical protein
MRRSLLPDASCIIELDATTGHELIVAAPSSTPPLLLPASRAPLWPSSVLLAANSTPFRHRDAVTTTLPLLPPQLERIK